jgi:hypothetical protein
MVNGRRIVVVRLTSIPEFELTFSAGRIAECTGDFPRNQSGTERASMKGAPAEWQQALSAVHGIIIHGEKRITTHELLTKHLSVPVTDKAARRL